MRKSGPLTPRGFQILLAPYVRAAGLKEVTPHSLRHSFCKNLVNTGVSLEKIAALAGHESLETTRRYCELSLQDLQQNVEMASDEDSSGGSRSMAPETHKRGTVRYGDLFVPLGEWELLNSGCRQ